MGITVRGPPAWPVKDPGCSLLCWTLGQRGTPPPGCFRPPAEPSQKHLSQEHASPRAARVLGPPCDVHGSHEAQTRQAWRLPAAPFLWLPPRFQFCLCPTPRIHLRGPPNLLPLHRSGPVSGTLLQHHLPPLTPVCINPAPGLCPPPQRHAWGPLDPGAISAP